MNKSRLSIAALVILVVASVSTFITAHLRGHSIPLPGSPHGASQAFSLALKRTSNDDHRDVFGGLPHASEELVTTKTLQVREDEVDETLVVPPYLDLVIFDVVRGRPDMQIAIFPPGQHRPLRDAADGMSEVRISAMLSTIAIHRPRPGRWTFRKSHRGGRVTIFSQQFFPRGTLVLPTGTARQHDRVAITYCLLDSIGLPLVELPDYPLSLELSLIKPNGKRVAFTMRREPRLGPAVFRMPTDTACDAPGQYWTEIRVRTRDIDQHAIEVFQDHWSGFQVVTTGHASSGRDTPSSSARS